MKITVEVQDVSGQLRLHEQVGNGQFGEYTFTLAVNLPDYSPLIKLNGKTYLVPIHDLVKAVCAQVVESSEE